MRNYALRLRLLRHRLAARGGRRTAAFVIAAAFVIMLIAVTVKLRPIAAQMAQYAVGDVVAQLVNEAIMRKVTEGGLDYDDLVTLETDADGSISALRTNMAKINVLQSEITSYVIDSVSKQLTTVIKIPLGNVIGGALLSGRGPNIPVRIVSVTNVAAAFSNEFSTAGINQTRHQIILSITVDAEALIPGKTITDTVTTDMVIAETVIVGAVPNTYAYLRQTGR